MNDRFETRGGASEVPNPQREEFLVGAPMELSPAPDPSDSKSSGLGRRAAVGLQMGVVAAELLPTNELMRGGVYTLAEAWSRNPLVGAAAAGLPTAIIEGVSGLATAALLDTPQAQRLIEMINEKGGKIGLPMDRKLSLPQKAFWTLLGGAPVGMLIEQRENSSRTFEENRRFATLTTAWQTGVLAVAGASGAKVLETFIGDPVKSTLTGGALAGIVGAGIWAKRKAQALMGRQRLSPTGAIIESVQTPEQEESQQYELYAQMVNEYGKGSPQHQGLTEIDFRNAAHDPRVITTDVERGGSYFEFPQLSPVGIYEWLNEGFYAGKFSEAFGRDALLHITSLPDMEPGDRVRKRLQELAQRDGTLVFDFPSSDPEYPQRIQRILDGLGIQGSEVEIIGTQTYFAGQSKLKGKAVEGPPLEFAEAYRRLVVDGEYDPARIKNGASMQTEIGPGEAARMRRFYDAAYKVLNEHPCNQGLDTDQFFEMITNQPWVTKIVNSSGGEAVALCLLSSKLDELDWINAEYYKERYPEKAANDQIVWFPGVAADPERPEKHNLQAMADLITEIAVKGDNEILVVFDCCDMNTGFLDVILNDIINRTPHGSIDIQPIAKQTYCAIQISPKQ
ncbi:MAG TPA: hypothetical protein VLH38_02310 [Patescibacteria group bacterium]|nr:hypothetical protein [Patescibacteria group bacterium]